MTSVAQAENASGVSDSCELTALVSGCGIYRVDSALFSITGRDRVRWLNGMLTNNVRDLAPGKGVYAFVLNAQGHILGDLYVFNRGENLVAEIERKQTDSLLQILRRYIIMDQVAIGDLANKALIAITGPEATRILASVGLTTDLEPLQFSDVNWNGVEVTAVRGDNPVFPAYELWIASDQEDIMWNALQNAGALPVAADTLETFRILCGIPKIGQDIRERTLPQETGQERALNFNKGCYIGQEIVERIRARGNVHRALFGFEIDGPAPAPGTKIQSGGKDVGEVTSISVAPLKQKRLALGFLRKEAAESGEALSAGEAVVKPRPLPFTDIFG